MPVFVNRVPVIAASLMLLGSMPVSQLQASDEDKRVVMTFSAPVEIPGHKVLPAGTYAFRAAPGNPGLVVITNGDGTRAIGMALAIPYISTAANPSVRFEERHAGDPAAVKSWSYPLATYPGGPNVGLNLCMRMALRNGKSRIHCDERRYSPTLELQLRGLRA